MCSNHVLGAKQGSYACLHLFGLNPDSPGSLEMVAAAAKQFAESAVDDYANRHGLSDQRRAALRKLCVGLGSDRPLVLVIENALCEMWRGILATAGWRRKRYHGSCRICRWHLLAWADDTTRALRYEWVDLSALV